MGKRSKGARSTARKQQRKADKAAKRALYESFGKAGRTKGSRRAKRKSQSVLTPSIKHPSDHCGNPGCRRCFSDLTKAKHGKPCLHQRLQTADRAKILAWLAKHSEHPLSVSKTLAKTLVAIANQVSGLASGSSQPITSEQAQAAFKTL